MYGMTRRSLTKIVTKRFDLSNIRHCLLIRLPLQHVFRPEPTEDYGHAFSEQFHCRGNVRLLQPSPTWHEIRNSAPRTPSLQRPFVRDESLVEPRSQS